MALAELLRALEEEAEGRIAEIRSRASAEAERIERESEADLARREATDLGAREAELRSAAAREVEEARRAAAGRVLEARSEALARVRQRVEARLAARAGDQVMLPWLVRGMERGLEYLDHGAVVVQAPAALLGELREAHPGAREVTFEPFAEQRAGLLLRSADGAVTVDATLEGVLAREWPAVAIELVRRIEEGA